MRPLDEVRFDAFARLLAQPDPPDLPHRATRLPGIAIGRQRFAIGIKESPVPDTATDTPQQAQLIPAGSGSVER